MSQLRATAQRIERTRLTQSNRDTIALQSAHHATFKSVTAGKVSLYWNFAWAMSNLQKGRTLVL
jgi:hypothetical protein